MTAAASEGASTGSVPAYADVVVEAIGDRVDLVVVAQSFGGYIAPIVCDRIPARLLVLVAAMIPAPGESAEDMFANTGRWLPGPTSRPDTCSVATTASSLPHGSVASCEIALASSPTRWTAVTRPPPATPSELVRRLEAYRTDEPLVTGR